MSGQLDFGFAVARARRTDPVTSHEAAGAVERSGRASVQRGQALDAVRRHPGRTSQELAELTGLDRYMLARRLPELREDLLVRNGPIRPCGITRRPAITWE